MTLTKQKAANVLNSNLFPNLNQEITYQSECVMKQIHHTFQEFIYLLIISQYSFIQVASLL